MNRWINGVIGLIVLAIAFVDLSGNVLTWVLGTAGAVLIINSMWGVFSETNQNIQGYKDHNVQGQV